MSLDRRLQSFETKLHHQIVVQNDEIGRYAEHLEFLKTQILQTKDALRRFALQSEQAQCSREGAKRRAKVHNQGKAAKLTADHHSIVQDLEIAHDSLLEQQGTEFQTTLNEIAVWAENLAKNRVGPVNVQIMRVHKQIAATKTKPLPTPIADTDDLTASSDFQRIVLDRAEVLETALRDKNAERLQGLLLMKQQLTACLETLEELETAHSGRVTKLKTQLVSVDNTYNKMLSTLSEQHRRAMAAAKSALDESNREADGIAQRVSGLQEDHLQRMLEVEWTTDQYRMELREVSSLPAPSRADVTKARDIQAKLDELKEMLGQREGLLDAERHNNESLRRAVSRLRDEARLAERRAALE
jgi:hypothetical protein